MNKKVVLSLLSISAIGGGLMMDKPVASASSNTVTIYLTRHGETTGNVMNLVQGWCDYPLTTNGVNTAKNLGRGLKNVKFQEAYAGNLTRQQVTAKTALKYSGNSKTKVQTSKNLREGGYGSFEGQSISDNNTKIAGVYGYQSSDEFMTKTGKDYWNKLQDAYYKLDQENVLNTKLVTSDRAENSSTVQKRMSKELLTIAKAAKKDKSKNVLVVSSGMSINEYLSTLKTDKYTGAPLKNAAVTKLVYKNGKLAVSGDIGSMKYVESGEKSSK